MQASVAADIEWRLSLYRNVLEFCRQGNFTLGRFLALVPQRLRLAVGESAAKTRIPVAVPDSLIARWRELMPPVGLPVVDRQATRTPDEVRRAIRFAQIDGDIDPVSTSIWLPKTGNSFANETGAIYFKGLSEVGSGEGGAETAYFIHLAVTEAVRRSTDAGPAHSARGRQAIAPVMLQLAVEGLLDSGAIDDAHLSAKLAYQYSVTVSTLSMGLTPADLLQSPVNPYRTVPAAVELAKKLLPDAVETTDLEVLREQLAGRLLASGEIKAAISLQLLAEAVRDLLLLTLMQHYRPDTEKDLYPARKIAASGALLQQHLKDPRRRDQLIAWSKQQRGYAPQPLTVLEDLLNKADLIASGQTQLLGRHGDLNARSRVAAAGAVVLAMDERIEEMKKAIGALVEWVPDNQQERSYLEGRCYRIDSDGEPLYVIPEERQEAHLFVDLKDFTKRTASIKEAAMGDFLRRFFYGPIFRLAQELQKGDEKSLAISNIVGDAVGFRGSVVPMVQLALGIRKILKEAEEELQKDLPDILGGKASVIPEIEEEIRAWQSQIARIDASLIGLSANDPVRLASGQKRKACEDQIRQLEAAREERLAESVGLGLEAGAYVAFGAAAEVVDLSRAALGLSQAALNEKAGYVSVTIAERLNEAARGTARSGILKAERDLRVAKLRKERASPRVTLPFLVSTGKSYQMDIPVPAGDAISAAIDGGDAAAATEAVQKLARWTLDEVQKQVRTRAGLPEAIGRSAEFYNAGCALSGMALAAYREATQGTLSFRQFAIEERQLPPAFLARWAFEFGRETFQTVTESATGRLVYLLRYSGKALFKGFEKEGGIDVWEILLPDSPFVRDLVQAVRQQPSGPAAGGGKGVREAV